MARGDVRYLVRHDARDLGLVVGGEDESLVDVEEAAGQREGVDLVGVYDLDGEGDLGVRVEHDVLADAVYVLGDDGVVYELGLAVYFRGELSAEADFLVNAARDLGDEDALVDVALAYEPRVFLLGERLAGVGRRRRGRLRGVVVRGLLRGDIFLLRLLLLLLLTARQRHRGERDRPEREDEPRGRERARDSVVHYLVPPKDFSTPAVAEGRRATGLSVLKLSRPKGCGYRPKTLKPAGAAPALASGLRTRKRLLKFVHGGRPKRPEKA